MDDNYSDFKNHFFFGFLDYCETNEKHQKFGLLVVHTKCNRLGGLDNRNLFSHNLKFKDKVWVKSVLKRELVDMCSHNFPEAETPVLWPPHAKS